VYHVDTKSGVAYQFSVPQTARGDFKYTGKNLSIEKMDKFFCVSPSYQLDLQFWVQDVVDISKKRCE
jgi:hypothetical protein